MRRGKKIVLLPLFRCQPSWPLQGTGPSCYTFTQAFSARTRTCTHTQHTHTLTHIPSLALRVSLWEGTGLLLGLPQFALL
jgi:hypothetical protein